MFQDFEALRALSKCKTMTRAAISLSISQPTMSRRIARLEETLGKKLIESEGRYVVLTPYAKQILQKAGPLLYELESALKQEVAEEVGSIHLAISRAVLTSWGARVLARTVKKLPTIELKIQARGGPDTIENVRSGESTVGIIRGSGESAPDLHVEHLLDDEIAIVPCGLKPFRIKKGMNISVMSLPSFSESQKILERKLFRLQKDWNCTFEILDRQPSSGIITALARNGFGHGLVPVRVALSRGVKLSHLVKLPKPGVSVPISFLCRKQALKRASVSEFLEALRKSL